MKDVGWVEHKRDPFDLIAMANALWNYIGPGVRGNSRRASESSVVSRLLVAVVLSLWRMLSELHVVGSSPTSSTSCR